MAVFLDMLFIKNKLFVYSSFSQASSMWLQRGHMEGGTPKDTQISKNSRFYEILHFWSLITGTEVIHQSSFNFFMYTQ